MENTTAAKEVRTVHGGYGTPRRIELLPNGFWRVDWTSGLVKLYASDPSESFARGFEPKDRV